MIDVLATAALQSGLLFLFVWLALRLCPGLPASWKAWVWRISFIKPLVALFPLAVVTLPLLQPKATAPQKFHTPAAAMTTIPPVPLVKDEESLELNPLLLVWSLGVVAAAAHGFAGRLRTLKVLRLAEPNTDAQVHTFLRETLARSGCRKSVVLRVSEHADSPALIGGRRASIVIPRASLHSDSDLRLMLAHEVGHLVRGDLFWTAVMWVVQALFFFNPLVWLAAYCARQDQESATDRYAAQLAGVPIQTYADMLLRVSVAASPLTPGALTMGGSYRSIRKRLEAMKHFETKLTRSRKAGATLVAALTLAAMPMYEVGYAAVAPTHKVSDQTPPSGGLPRPGSDPKSLPPGTVHLKVSRNLVDMEAQNADLRKLLIELFQKSGKDFSIDPNVEGTATAQMQNVDFNTALNMLLRQAYASYRIEKNVYHIFFVGQVPPSPAVPSTPAPTRTPQTHKRITLNAKRADVRFVLRDVFRQADVSYTIAPDVTGTVTVSGKNMRFEVALKKVLSAAGATYTIGDNVYNIVHSTP